MFNLFNRQKNDSNGDYDYWRKEAEKARSLARSYENGMISTPAMRNRDDAHYGNLTKRVIEVMRLNRALRRRNYTVRRQREQLNELRQAAIELRLAQRNYMQAKADPGMGAEDVEHMGRNVGTAAAKLDLLLPPYTAADKIMSHQEHRKITITGKLSAKELLDAIHGSGGHG